MPPSTALLFVICLERGAVYVSSVAGSRTLPTGHKLDSIQPAGSPVMVIAVTSIT